MYDAPDLVTYMFHRDLCQRGKHVDEGEKETS